MKVAICNETFVLNFLLLSLSHRNVECTKDALAMALAAAGGWGILVVLICFPSLGISPFGHGVLDRNALCAFRFCWFGAVQHLAGLGLQLQLGFIDLNDPLGALHGWLKG